MSHATLAIPALSDLSLLDQARVGFLARYDGLTRAQYEYQIGRWVEWCYAHGLDPMKVQRTHLELYVRDLSENRGLKASSVGSTLSPVVGMYRFAFIDGILTVDPGSYIRLPKVSFQKKNPLDRDDLKSIRRAGKQLGGRHWAMAELLVVHALRISETRLAMIENMQDTERGHRVLRFRRKGGRWETIPLPVVVLLALEDAAGERDSGPIIASREGELLSRSGATSLVDTLLKQTKIDRHVNPHLIRASVLTDAFDQGMSPRDVQNLAGHLDPRTTATYDLGLFNHDNHPAHMMAARLTAA